MKKRERWFVGRRIDNYRLTAFPWNDGIPSTLTHGDVFLYCIGPFDTKRGAMFLERYLHTILNNVHDIERFAKREADAHE